MRWEYDIVNPAKDADIMMVMPDWDDSTGASPSGHPFHYARVLGIFHADIISILPDGEASVQKLEFLWVHWYQRDVAYKAGFQHRCLHHLELASVDSPSACGFLNPDNVIWGIHLIPGFAHGLRTVPAHGSTTPTFDSPGLDWRYYYMNW